MQEDELHELAPDDPSHPFPAINRDFYENYDIEYFGKKAVLLGRIIADAKPTKEHMGQGYKIGKITVVNPQISQKWLIGYAKREMVINSYHAIETFFRLLFAHSEQPDCPWVGVAELQSFQKFKKKITKLLQRKYFKGSHEESLAKLLLNGRSAYPSMTDEQWNMNVKNIVELVDRLANDILANQDYNVYKHGAALLDTKFGFRIGDGKLLGVKKQDSFAYLSTKTEILKDKNIKVVKFQKTFKVTRWQQRFVTTHFAGQLIHNLVVFKKLQMGLIEPKHAKVNTFYGHNWKKILDDDFKGGIVMNSLGQSLFERHYPL